MLCQWTERSLLQLSGADRKKLLQGLITNNIDALSISKPLFTALLTPQGKFDTDFIVCEHQDNIFLLVETAIAEEIETKLKRYKLRLDVTLTPLPAAIYRIDAQSIVIVQEHLRFKDPRHPALGDILILFHDKDAFEKSHKASFTPPAVYEERRLQRGIPEGSKDLTRGKSVILEFGYDELGAIDWQKGCYLGQELMTRTKHQGQLRNYIFPLLFHNTMPQPGDKLTINGQTLGKLLTTQDNLAIARLKLEPLRPLLMEGNTSFTTDQGALTLHLPVWISDQKDIYTIAHL